jgi:septation ring formation regulator EzrA
MQPQIEQRLQELKAEFTSGQKMLAELEAKEINLRETLLRISGAIQVLEELLTQEKQSKESASKQPPGET